VIAIIALKTTIAFSIGSALSSRILAVGFNLKAILVENGEWVRGHQNGRSAARASSDRCSEEARGHREGKRKNDTEE